MATYTWVPSRGSTGSSSGGPSTTELYVSTTGSDAAAGTEAAPFATIEGARAAIRSRGLAGTATVNVNVKAGTYYQTSTTTFAAADSGSSSFPIRYRSCDGIGQARIVAGTRASGWTLHSGSIYKLALSAPCYTLYENGVRATRCRFPVLNPGASYPCAFAPYFLTVGTTASYTDLKYSSGDFDPSLWALADTRIFTYGTNTNQIDWFSEHAQPTSLNTGSQTYVIGNGGLKFPAYGGVNPGSRFFIEGPLQLLQGPGEFCIRQDAGVWTLYYWPRAAPIASQEIIIPALKTAFSFLGTDTTTRCKYITFQGFQVDSTDFDSWYRYGDNGLSVEYNYFDTASQFRQGAIRMENVDHITLQWNHIKNTGFAGVFMQGYCQTNTCYQNWIEHTGTDGISVNGMPPGSGQLSTGNMFDDQRINNMGELDASANGIRLSQSGSNTIRYHKIYSGPRRAVWMHGDFGVAAAQNYCRSNYVHHVLAVDMMQDTGDAGSLTTSFLSSPAGGGSTIPVNTYEQCIMNGANAHASMVDQAPNAFFCDNDSSGQVATNMQHLNIQGFGQRYNSSDGWTFTNCSWVGGFNPALMDTANIGTTASFPFA